MIPLNKRKAETEFSFSSYLPVFDAGFYQNHIFCIRSFWIMCSPAASGLFYYASLTLPWNM